MEKFWMVWNDGNRNSAYKHPSEQSAKNEAERLAMLNPGQLFHVLEATSFCRANDVEWDDHIMPVPF
jgi:hypothetical protein